MPRKHREHRALAHTPVKKTVEPAPFAEHLRELRRRLFFVALSVGAGTAAAYGVQQHIVVALLKPAHGQHFIYTSPGGGLDFLFRVCLYTGIALSIPIIVFNVLRYLEPIFPKHSTKFVYYGSAISGILALAGVIFGYFVGLPAALNFLLHQFVTTQIQPLVTVQSYMAFVTVYMLGSALLFQIPLFIIFINRIKPIKPSSLFKYERWVILLSFVAAGLMNPTPRIFDQLLVAGPMILMYQISIGLVAFINRIPKSRRTIQAMLPHDQALQAEREARLRDATTTWTDAIIIGDTPPALPPKPTQLSAGVQSFQEVTPAASAPTKRIQIPITPEPVKPVANQPRISDFIIPKQT